MTHALDLEDEDDERDELEFENETGVDATLLLPRPLMRLAPRRGLRALDFAAATAALMLTFARGVSWHCGRRTCRARGICQQPPLSCAMRRYADIYNWDESLAHGPRAKMYDAIEAKRDPDSDKPNHHPEEVRKHTPNLARELLDR